MRHWGKSYIIKKETGCARLDLAGPIYFSVLILLKSDYISYLDIIVECVCDVTMHRHKGFKGGDVNFC